jgi:hypothetical protein
MCLCTSTEIGVLTYSPTVIMPPVNPNTFSTMPTDTARAPKIPPEIVDAFIDQVNVSVLGVCSLVSKSWLPRSRRHLFERVVIIRDGLKPFLDLLDSPLCTVKPFVQIVELRGYWIPDPRWVELGLSAILSLPAVRDFCIVSAGFTSPDSPKILPSFQNLQDLALSDCEFTSVAQLLDALSLCKSLKNVLLSSLIIRDSDVAVSSPPPPSLRCVDLHTFRANSFVKNIAEWLVSGEHISIETLKLSIPENDIQAIAHCVRGLGPSLKTLEVDFPINDRHLSCQG